MVSRIAVGVGAAALAALAGYAAGRLGASDTGAKVAAPITPAARSGIDYAPPPKVSAEEAASQREQLYTGLNSIDDTLALPTDFAQTEALFALAGRADEDTLLRLIGEAAAIGQQSDRLAALQILYLRYVELDPHAAVAQVLSRDRDVAHRLLDVMFSAWSKVDLNAAIDGANSLATPSQRKWAGTAILRAYAQNDPGMLPQIAASLTGHYNLLDFRVETLRNTTAHAPALAFQQALAIGNQRVRQRALHGIAAAWAQTDPAAAFAAAQNISDQSSRSRFLHRVIQQWTENDHEAAIAAVQALPSSVLRPQLLSSAVAQLAKSDPAAAMQIAEGASSTDRMQVYQGLFNGWSDADPRAAAQAAMEWPPSSQRSNWLQLIARNYATVDPQAALAWASELPGNDARQAAGSALASLARNDPQGAILALSSTSADRLDGRTVAMVVESIARHDPAAAASLLGQVATTSSRQYLHSSIASHWANVDPDAAMTWADSLSGGAYQQAVSGIAATVAHGNPELATRLLDRVRGEARAEWLSSIAGGLASSDPSRALAWLQQFSGESGYGNAVVSTIPYLAESDPMAAIRASRQLDPRYQAPALHATMHQWAQSDPQSAARWVLNSADESQRQSAADAMLNVWLHTDSAAAHRWVQNLPAGPLKDSGLSRLLNDHTLSYSQQDAIVASIETDRARESAIAQVFMQRYHNDPAGAVAYLENANISDLWRQQLLQQAGSY